MRKLLASTFSALAMMASLAGAVQAQPYRPLPPPRYEVRPPLPHPGYVWRPGYWNWAGGRYVWIGGVYIVPGGPEYGGYGPGVRWIPGHWNGRGAWVPAHWGR